MLRFHRATYRPHSGFAPPGGEQEIKEVQPYALSFLSRCATVARLVVNREKN